MIRATLHAIGLLGLTASLSFGSLIVDGMTAYGVYTSDGQIFNQHYGTPGFTRLHNGLDAGSRFVFGGTSAMEFNGGGSFTPGAYLDADYNSFYSLTSALSGVGGSALGSWSGVTPGNYTFTTAPTSLHLSTPGTYIFTYVGGLSTLEFNNVSITLGPGVGSDDVIWYIPKDVKVYNSVFGGVLVADGFGIRLEGNGGSTHITGRVLGQTNVAIDSWNGGTVSFRSQTAVDPSELPEPATVLLFAPALALGFFVKRRLSRQ